MRKLLGAKLGDIDAMAAEEPQFWMLVAASRDEALKGGGLAGLSPPEREARLFAHMLERVPIGIEPGSVLAGDFGLCFATAEQMARLERSAGSRPAPPPPGKPTATQLLNERFQCRAGYTAAHTCADYERVINEGIEGIQGQVREALAGADPEQAGHLRAMETALSAVTAWAHRYARLARARAAAEPCSAGTDPLNDIARRCERVPGGPARDFAEAVQSVWLMHAAIGLSELSGSSLSLGRLDQYLYPLFQSDLQRGVPEQVLRDYLLDLWRKLNRFGDPACAVNLGGVDQRGADLFNPLSEMIVQVSRELRLPSPILAARVHKGMPREAFDLLVDADLFTMGQPTFYGEAACRQAMVRRGIPPEQAHRFALNSCMGIVMPGEEISDMWGAVVNLLLPLELTLNAGEPFGPPLPIRLQTAPRDSYESFDELYEQFEAYADELVGFMIGRNQEATGWMAENRPNPFLSALTRDCIARGRDRAGGGPRYHCVIVEGFGWCNAADALTAVEHLVYRARRYTIPELVAAAKNDFAGEGDILADLLHCPKYGNADEVADTMACRVSDSFARAVSRHSQGGIHYLPSYHTLNAHVGAGKALGASLDGRRTGEALGKNIGPMLGRATGGPTSLLLSASTIDQAAMSGGQALDISVAPSTLRGEDARRKFQDLLLTYFGRGGLQVQVNGLTPDQLRRAIDDPQSHQELTVKIAGYSERFVRLSRELQHEMVARIEQGL